ncbi:LacI family DNA-binding transcriptional regulator [Aurantimonas sp. VKM B-3413]|uniref:LacI family DNA-binding transcriptional regulator n=1 Tax=Aurantimonas sp. VKM B-3413 TaxID=2779401 RepID=UPI001E39C900|nr:substrate-binding domain-containing protein [Aurantimonas sp. VKM B-3413]MCB8836248.1 substrate-binding domain-containing protein [Aurantimonas sp. VKM B-3413]
MKRSVTLRQVAEHARVSASTASLVLNGKGDISEATRQRVMRAVSEMNYVPRAGRARPEAGNTISFLKIAKHGHTVNRDHNHFISDYIDGMSFEATRRDYSLHVVSIEGSNLRPAFDAISNGDLSGVVVLGTELAQEDVQSFQREGLPMVFIDTFFPQLDANFVDMDNAQSIYQAIEHLKDRGFTRIGLVGSYSAVTNFSLRQQAFSSGLAALGLSAHGDAILSVESTLDGAYQDGLRLLKEGAAVAEAYCCVNDIVALGFMRALKECGYRVPEDVSLIGFDNLPMSAIVDPPLTTIEVPKQRIGAMAIRLLDDLIVSETPQPAVKALISGRLVLRDSTLPSKEPFGNG